MSEGVFAGLNGSFHSGDTYDKVAENRRRMAKALGADNIVTAKQIHSARALFIEEPFAFDERPEADALVTRTPGLAVGVLAADCVPVLFEADGIVAAAHAGWRGSLRGILEATAALMEEHGADRTRIKAVIGPHLRREHFEVRGDLISQVRAKYPVAERHFTKISAEHHLYDHTAFVRDRLIEAGLSEDRIADVGGDTLGTPESLFSYRAACARGEQQFGHNLSAIRPG